MRKTPDPMASLLLEGLSHGRPLSHYGVHRVGKHGQENHRRSQRHARRARDQQGKSQSKDTEHHANSYCAALRTMG